ncbi:MAG: CmcJ/NvfI family oxidoreductase [Gammaproteobacteria bacterium]|nr:CmcJ/NvfI family oxidoreductase [Gammaproteobacteria bacterium]
MKLNQKTSTATGTNEASAFSNVVRAPLKFRVQTDEKPAIHASTPGAAAAGAFEWHTIAIADGRSVVDRLSLETEGFELRPHDTAVSNFYDDEQVRTVYYPEVEQLVKAATGASRVVIFDHTLRIEDDAHRDARAVRGPVHTVHNDYTERSGPRRVHDLLDAEDAANFLGHRFAIVNVWRSIGAPIETTPIAIADAQSIARESLLATDLVRPDRIGEIYQVVYRPDQRWFYFPNMRRDEALLLKCFDSATDGRARFTAHTAFDNPAAADDAPPRESIEVRTLISFAPVIH